MQYYISEAEYEYWTADTVDPRNFTQERIDGQAMVAKPVLAAVRSLQQCCHAYLRTLF